MYVSSNSALFLSIQIPGANRPLYSKDGIMEWPQQPVKWWNDSPSTAKRIVSAVLLATIVVYNVDQAVTSVTMILIQDAIVALVLGERGAGWHNHYI